MRAPAVWPVLLALLITSLAPSAFSLADGGFKQATRSEILNRVSKDETHAPKPRRSIAPCTTPSGMAPNEVEGDSPDYSAVYNRYYSGTGFMENSDNPGNSDTDSLPITTTIAYTDVANAVQQCANIAIGDALTYLSFDLSFLQSTCSWSCTAYFNPNEGADDASYFNVANPDVVLGYGYSETF